MSQASDALDALFSPQQGAPTAAAPPGTGAPQSKAAQQLEALFANIPLSGGAPVRASSGNPYLDMIPQGNAGSASPAPPSMLADVAKSAGVGLAKGVNSIIGAPAALKSFVNLVADKALGPIPEGAPRGPQLPLPSGEDVQKTEESVTGPFYQPQTKAGKFAETAGEFVPSAVALPGGIGARALNAVRYGVIPGVTSEAAGQATEGTPAEPFARAAGGIAGGIAGPALMRAPARLITPLPAPTERQNLVSTLEKEGVPLTAGQVTGNKPLQWAESTLSDVPFAGGRAAELQREQKQAFTQAALKRAGINEPLASPDVLETGAKTLGSKFEAVASRNTLQMDKKFGQDLSKTISEYEGLVPPTARAPGVHGLVNDLLSSAITGQPVPGEAYQAIRSRLTKQAQSLRMSDPPQAQAYRDIRNALDNAMDRSIMRTNPKDLGAWSKLRKEYANFKAVEKAAGAAGEAAAEGFVSPAQLRTAIASGKNRSDYARGKGDLAELARAGVGVMSPLPQSGTAPRSFIQGALTGGGFMAGGLPGAAAGLAGPAIAGRVLMSKPVQGYLKNQITTKFGTFPRTKAGARALAAAMQANAALKERSNERK